MTSENLKEGTDAGEVIIQEFREAFEAGRVDLGSVFQQIQNDQLRAIPEIRILLELKGLGEDAGDSGE